MGLSGGLAASATTNTIWKVASPKPAWLTSLAASDHGDIPAIEKVFTTLAAGTTAVLVEGNRNALVVQSTYGFGRVLFCTTKIENNAFFTDVMPRIVSDFADSNSNSINLRQ
jgi:hypothetical protein